METFNFRYKKNECHKIFIRFKKKKKTSQYYIIFFRLIKIYLTDFDQTWLKA